MKCLRWKLGIMEKTGIPSALKYKGLWKYVNKNHAKETSEN